MKNIQFNGQVGQDGYFPYCPTRFLDLSIFPSRIGLATLYLRAENSFIMLENDLAWMLI